MPKYKYVVKNEQVLNEFMEKLWRHLGRKKGRKFVKSLFKDPDLILKIKDAEDAADDLYVHLTKDDEQLRKDLKKVFPNIF